MLSSGIKPLSWVLQHEFCKDQFIGIRKVWWKGERLEAVRPARQVLASPPDRC